MVRRDTMGMVFTVFVATGFTRGDDGGFDGRGMIGQDGYHTTRGSCRDHQVTTTESTMVATTSILEEFGLVEFGVIPQ